MDGLGWETARVIKGISWWDHTLAAVRKSHYCVAVAFGCIIRRFRGEHLCILLYSVSECTFAPGRVSWRDGMD